MKMIPVYKSLPHVHAASTNFHGAKAMRGASLQNSSLHIVFQNMDKIDSTETILTVDKLDEESNDLFISRFLFAASRGDLEGLKSLVSQGANPNLADYDGRTPMHVACSKGHAEIVHYLISIGANVNAIDRFNGKPRDDAVRHGFDEISEILIKAGADKPSTQFENDLINASFNGDLLAVEKLLNAKVSPNCSDYDGRTPLHLAAAKRNIEVARILLTFGANPNAEGNLIFSSADRFGGTPLADAVRNKKRLGQDEIVDLLREYAEKSKGSHEKHDSRDIFMQPLVQILAIFQLAMLLLHGFFSTYSTNSTEDNSRYGYYQDVHVMIFIGFGKYFAHGRVFNDVFT